MIEIVSDCFGRHFAATLVYQLSSLIMYESEKVIMTVLYSSADRYVTPVLEFFGRIERPWIIWNFVPMRIEELNNRPIGRDIISKITKSDIIWYADSDYVFGDGCLNGLVPFPNDGKLYSPRIFYFVRIDLTKTVIDNGNIKPSVIDIDLSNSSQITTGRIVGGMQIISGDTARKIGYLPNHPKYQVPLKRFTRDDGTALWRNNFNSVGQGRLELPNCYRIF